MEMLFGESTIVPPLDLSLQIRLQKKPAKRTTKMDQLRSRTHMLYIDRALYSSCLQARGQIIGESLLDHPASHTKKSTLNKKFRNRVNVFTMIPIFIFKVIALTDSN